MKIEGLLPIGSVVIAKEANHRVMVTGYGHRLVNSEKVYDYSGVLWPEGYVGAEQSLVFNHEDIDQVFFVGFQTDGSMVYINQVEAALANFRGGQTEA